MKGHIASKLASSIMMDTGATHNFIFEGEAKKLGLKLKNDLGHMKAVNFKAFTTIGVAKQVMGSLVRGMGGKILWFPGWIISIWC